MNSPLIQSLLVAGGLAAAIHLDWHAARHGNRLSLGWSYHWLLAIPVFAAAAVHTVHAWPRRFFLASVSVVAAAAMLGQVVEPLMEVILLGASLGAQFSEDRLTAFGKFFGTGVVTFAAVAWLIARVQSKAGRADGPP